MQTPNESAESYSRDNITLAIVDAYCREYNIALGTRPLEVIRAVRTSIEDFSRDLPHEQTRNNSKISYSTDTVHTIIRRVYEIIDPSRVTNRKVNLFITREILLTGAETLLGPNIDRRRIIDEEPV
jgi:hypothetical protein